jgi:FemAB-related protein (PEP-CTERM system-associated)
VDPGPAAVKAVSETAGAWSDAVHALTHSNLAHAPEWFAAIRKAYGHDPLYLMASDDDGARGVLPAFIVRRPLFGTVVTSMPYMDAGGPCAQSASLSHALVERVFEEARRAGARYIELRCKEPLAIGFPAMEHKVTLTRTLPADPARLWAQVPNAVRNQVRKARRSGLSVEFGGPEKFATFYQTFAVRMRELGSPVHAAGFLEAVLEEFGARARVALIRKGSTPVGGLIAIAFKDTLTVPWASCESAYFSLCPNMLLYWEALQAACAEGFARFDFGRSTRDSGTYRFKRQWGAEEESLFWYTIPTDLRRSAPSASNGHRATLSRVWQRLPLPLTRHLGPPIRRYLTQ